jgi:sulfatase maturation enzyme AslB (radical SAM superfamily)
MNFNNTYLTLELSSYCNLNCEFCSQHNSKLVNKSFLSFELFKKIINELADSKDEMMSINPYFRGESLLHPEFVKMMDYLYQISEEKTVCEYIVLHTNGLLLDNEKGEAILRLCDQSRLKHPGNLVISIDAASRGKYKAVRGGDFELLLNNIRNFLKLRMEKNQWGPNVIFQFIMMEENTGEELEFFKLFSRICSENSHKKLRALTSFNNKSFEVQGDLVYYRMQEGDPLSSEKLNQDYRKRVNELREKIEDLIVLESE